MVHNALRTTCACRTVAFLIQLPSMASNLTSMIHHAHVTSRLITLDQADASPTVSAPDQEHAMLTTSASDKMDVIQRVQEEECSQVILPGSQESFNRSKKSSRFVQMIQTHATDFQMLLPRTGLLLLWSSSSFASSSPSTISSAN